VIGAPTVIEVSDNTGRAFDKFADAQEYIAGREEVLSSKRSVPHLGIELSISGLTSQEFEGYATRQRVRFEKSEPQASHPVYCTSGLEVRRQERLNRMKGVKSEIERIRGHTKCPKKYIRDMHWTEYEERCQETR
jgi:hypothetical protein